MAARDIAQMTRSQFTAHVKTLTPAAAERARNERRRVMAQRWRKENPERAREAGRTRWSRWHQSLGKKERAQFLAQDAERKRRERAAKRSG